MKLSQRMGKEVVSTGETRPNGNMAVNLLLLISVRTKG
jgi:hypothetical protein